MGKMSPRPEMNTILDRLENSCGDNGSSGNDGAAGNNGTSGDDGAPTAGNLRNGGARDEAARNASPCNQRSAGNLGPLYAAVQSRRVLCQF